MQTIDLDEAYRCMVHNKLLHPVDPKTGEPLRQELAAKVRTHGFANEIELIVHNVLTQDSRFIFVIPYFRSVGYTIVKILRETAQKLGLELSQVLNRDIVGETQSLYDYNIITATVEAVTDPDFILTNFKSPNHQHHALVHLELYRCHTHELSDVLNEELRVALLGHL